MNDKEVALKLTELRGIHFSSETYLSVYLDTLERIRNSKSKTIIGKLEKYFTKPNKFIERPERMKILDKLKALKEDK